MAHVTKQGSGYLCGLQDEVVDDDLLLVGEAQSVLTDERDSEGDAVHGLFPTRPVNKFIFRLQKNNGRSNKVCYRYLYLSNSISIFLFY